jgi:hypothetical protein
LLIFAKLASFSKFFANFNQQKHQFSLYTINPEFTFGVFKKQKGAA